MNASKHVPFLHIHNHSHYSLGDAISQIEDIFALADQYKMPGVALTDHGNLFGAAEFFYVAKKYPHIKPIIGCEVYLTDFAYTEKKKLDSGKVSYHLLLLAKNEIGYQNLCRLISLSYTQGFYYKPRIDMELLSQHHEGLIASSACLAGKSAQLVLQDKLDSAKAHVLQMQQMMGEGNYYLEIMNHGFEEENKVAEAFIRLGKELNTPVIATNDVHYPHQKDAQAHDIFLCIGTGKKITDSKRKNYQFDSFYFKNYEDMQQTMEKYGDIYLENTLHILESCSYFPKMGQNHVPQFPIEEDKSSLDVLKEKVWQGIEKLYPVISEEVKLRVEKELRIVESMNFEDYFLIVQEFIEYAKNAHIAVGPGRGSAAGSILAYSLGITSIDPLKYGLLFERFLNPGRVSLPDIDTDFDDVMRDKVIQHVMDKYGESRVAHIVTFGRMKARMVLRDVCRVLDIPISKADLIAKKISPHTNLATARKQTPELDALLKQEDILEQMWNYALRLENLIRHTSIHAAGIIIGDADLQNYLPLYKDPQTGIIASQFEGKYLEDFGFLKMDFLGLKNLRTISQAEKSIQIRHPEFSIEAIPLDDKASFEIFQKGDGLGIFQCESVGIQQLMKEIHPDSFEDIIALLALYRPGPLNSGMTKSFIENKKNPEGITYAFPELQSILHDTYGVLLYQEQIMQIAEKIGQFSPEEADNLRKAMGKKNKVEMESKRQSFIENGAKKGYDSSALATLFDNMAKFAEYGFNKSHSTAYAVIAYQTAYLKSNYTGEFFCALLNTENSSKSSSFENIGKYLPELQKWQIQLYPPDINKSDAEFFLEENKIIFSLPAIKNVGENIAQTIQKERQEHGAFTSLVDLAQRVALTSQTWEAFIYTGALDAFIPNRKTAIQALDKIIQIQSYSKKALTLGESLFGGDILHSSEDLFPSVLEEFTLLELMDKERFYMGFSFQEHPTSVFRPILSEPPFTTVQHILNLLEEELEVSSFWIGGYFSQIDFFSTKKMQSMAKGIVEDFSGRIPWLMYPTTLKKFQSMLNQDGLFILGGNKCTQDGSLIVEQLIPLSTESLLKIQSDGKRKATSKRNPSLADSEEGVASAPESKKRPSPKKENTKNPSKSDSHPTRLKITLVDSLSREELETTAEQILVFLKETCTPSNSGEGELTLEEKRDLFHLSIWFKEACLFDSQNQFSAFQNKKTFVTWGKQNLQGEFTLDERGKEKN